MKSIEDFLKAHLYMCIYRGGIFGPLDKTIFLIQIHLSLTVK